MAQTATSISGEKAQYGLSCLHDPALPQVDNEIFVGFGLQTVTWADANIAYAFKVTPTGATDKVTLTLSSGARAQTVGTPTISPSGAVDPEGVALGTLATLYAVLTVVDTTGTGTVIINGATTEPFSPGGVHHHIPAGATGLAITSETFSWLNSAADGFYTVVVIGKTA